ncbi:MAG: TlyA family RNA methyltransferase [Puniceicoccales bacterium]|jgi:23S rRNA (cytidine1920-2'-O)/16S rRNA (cytidine1409-2'-O)-methyltransferase|nr:TlyA family RNA methyltransferase [Puniceicoccales bacterium]
MATKFRADELLVESGLAESRTAAARMIMAGQVFTDSMSVDKPSRTYGSATKFYVKNPPRYVSRGGEKLAGFFRIYGEPLAGKRILDIGASTGGFTDFLLQNGAASAVCVDVGHGQLHYKLRSDGRVTCIEGANGRRLGEILDGAASFHLVVMDLSFISLKKILREAWPFLSSGGLLIALIKPQFEATKEEARQWRGVIGDESIRSRVRSEIADFIGLNLSNAAIVAEMESPIVGADGNVEFFIGARKI